MEPSWGLWHRFPLGPHVVCRRSIAQEFARLTDEHSLVHTFSSVASCKACAIVKLHGFHGHFVVDDQLKAIALIPATRLAAGTLRRHGDGHLNTSLSVRIVHSPAGFADIALRFICILADVINSHNSKGRGRRYGLWSDSGLRARWWRSFRSAEVIISSKNEN